MRVLLLSLLIFARSGNPVQDGHAFDLALVRLGDRATTARAGADLRQMVPANDDLRDKLSVRLPAMLLAANDLDVVESEAEVAGALKIVDTIPCLVKLLSRPNQRFGDKTLTRYAQLSDDPVGRALANMGSAAVGPLSAALTNRDVSTRERAVRVLLLINLPESRLLLARHLEEETDEPLRNFMQANGIKRVGR